MPTLTLTNITLTNEQVVALVEQLPRGLQVSLYQTLRAKLWENWLDLAQYGEGQARRVAVERGRNWDTLTDDERMEFVDDIVHED